MYWRLTIVLFLGISEILFAQSRSRIIPPEGLYLRASSLSGQIPEFSWESVSGEWYVGEEDHYLRGRFYHAGSGDLIRPLVVCLDGGCYLLDPVRTDTTTYYYAPLIECGTICVYRIERQYPVQVPIRAYNPANGRPFLETTVERSSTSEQLMMWRPESNEHALLSAANYSNWTGAEEQSTIRESELIKGIRTYNLIFAQGGRSQNQE